MLTSNDVHNKFSFKIEYWLWVIYYNLFIYIHLNNVIHYLILFCTSVTWIMTPCRNTISQMIHVRCYEANCASLTCVLAINTYLVWCCRE